MTVLLYAITPAGGDGEAGAGLPGLYGNPLREITRGTVRATVSDVEQTPSLDETTVWEYEQVVERLMARIPVLPARFNTTAEDDEEIAAMLIRREDELRAALERVTGAIEFAVRAGPPRPRAAATAQPAGEPQSERPGTAYMRRLADQERPFREIEAAMGDSIREQRRRGQGSVAYLVERDHAEEFIAAAQAAGATLTGPWPPFSFVS